MPSVRIFWSAVSPAVRSRYQPVAAAALGREVQVSEAYRFAANVLPLIQTIRAAGVTSLRGIAAALNARGVPTARGGRWQVSNVRNVLRRQQLR